MQRREEGPEGGVRLHTRAVATSLTSTSVSLRLQLRFRPREVLEVGVKGTMGATAYRCGVVWAYGGGRHCPKALSRVGWA